MDELTQLRNVIEDALNRIRRLSSRPSPPPPPPPPPDHLRHHLKCVQIRKELAPSLSECAWIMLLVLYDHRSSSPFTVTSACVASMYAPTTALRWLEVLYARRFVERLLDANDSRRVFLRITPAGIDLVEEWKRRLSERAVPPKLHAI